MKLVIDNKEVNVDFWSFFKLFVISYFVFCAITFVVGFIYGFLFL